MCGVLMPGRWQNNLAVQMGVINLCVSPGQGNIQLSKIELMLFEKHLSTQFVCFWVLKYSIENSKKDDNICHHMSSIEERTQPCVFSNFEPACGILRVLWVSCSQLAWSNCRICVKTSVFHGKVIIQWWTLHLGGADCCSQNTPCSLLAPMALCIWSPCPTVLVGGFIFLVSAWEGWSNRLAHIFGMGQPWATTMNHQPACYMLVLLI